jgi:hypothetical protein
LRRLGRQSHTRIVAGCQPDLRVVLDGEDELVKNTIALIAAGHESTAAAGWSACSIRARPLRVPRRQRAPGHQHHRRDPARRGPRRRRRQPPRPGEDQPPSLTRSRRGTRRCRADHHGHQAPRQPHAQPEHRELRRGSLRGSAIGLDSVDSGPVGRRPAPKDWCTSPERGVEGCENASA